MYKKNGKKQFNKYKPPAKAYQHPIDESGPAIKVPKQPTIVVQEEKQEEYTDEQVTQIIQEGLENGDIQVEINDKPWKPISREAHIAATTSAVSMAVLKVTRELKECQRLLQEAQKVMKYEDSHDPVYIQIFNYLNNNNLLK